LCVCRAVYVAGGVGGGGGGGGGGERSVVCVRTFHRYSEQ